MEAEQLDTVAIFDEPASSCLVDVVAWPIVDDQEHLAATSTAYDLLEEGKEGAGVEHRRELVQERGAFFEGDDAKDVRRLAHPKGIYARLLAHPQPSSIERPVEPEARLVPEGNNAAALAGFFLPEAGSRGATWLAGARSARARRLRGRWTENPSWCNSLGR